LVIISGSKPEMLYTQHVKELCNATR